MPKKYPKPKQAPRKFNPHGRGYDYRSARAAGLSPDATGHWPSREPKSGLILKGRAHETYHKTEAAEKRAGHTIRQRKNGRYYSTKDKK